MAFFKVAFFIPRPLHTDTAKASMLTPIANSSNSPSPIDQFPPNIFCSEGNAPNGILGVASDTDLPLNRCFSQRVGLYQIRDMLSRKAA
jgi:hypothetical protein